EYLLNGKLCRLRDIQELFMGTGLGTVSYALIEQGRIGQILSSRPTDRRAIIEEAAGITKFKTKKRVGETLYVDAKQKLAHGKEKRRHNDERGTELIIRAGFSENELAQAQHRLTTFESERDSNQQVLDSAAADVAAAQQELARCQQEANAAATALAELEQQQGASRLAIMEAVAAASNLRNQLTQAEERLAAVDREGQRLHA